MSVASPTLFPANGATNGCGTVCTHSSQCLYIRSSITIPLALSRSGYLSTVRSPYFTCEMKSTLLSSGENLNPSISPANEESCTRSLPSGFISQIWLLPSASGARKASLQPFLLHAGSPSLAAVVVSNWFPEPSAFIT